MKYLDALNERNKENQARKNLVMNRPTKPTGKPGRHSTDGKDRGRKRKPPQKVRGVEIRAGDTSDVTTAGKTGETTASNRLIGRNRPFAAGALKHHTDGPDGKLSDHTEYKRMGLLMAESLGYRIDEFVPALLRVGSGIVRGVGAAARTVGGVTKNVALNMAKKRAKKKAMEKEQDMDQNQMEAYKQIGVTLAEAVTKKVGPIASQYSGMGRVKSKKKGEGARSIGDPVVRKAVSGANKRVGEKLGIKANLPTDVAAQQGLENRRRRFRRKGIGLPAPSRKEREADARQDVERRKGPDDE